MMLQKNIDVSKYYRDNIVYFPVRHHSPVCYKKLEELLKEFKPDVILIEGPSDADGLIESIVNSKLPVAIYGKPADSSQSGVAYPFFATSPEYLALKHGIENKIETHFIDVPAYNAPDLSDVSSPFEYNNYIDKVVESSGMNSFEQYFDKHFEVNLSSATIEKFLEVMLTYCYHTRQLSENTPYNQLREQKMVTEILKYTDKKVVVVTGGFHTIALPDLVDEAIKSDFEAVETPKDNEVYLIPYNIKNISTYSGYQSGVLYPLYYDTLVKNKHDYQATFIELIHNYFKNVKRNVDLSKVIFGVEAALELAKLRGKAFPSIYELFDTFMMVTSDIKTNEELIGEENLFKSYLIGDAFGEVTDDAYTPPLVRYIKNKIDEYKLLPNQKHQLYIMNNKKALEKSLFVSKCRELGIDLISEQYGLDLFNLRFDNLLNQTIFLNPIKEFIADVINVSHMGHDVDVALSVKILSEFKQENTLATLCGIYQKIVIYGLANMEKSVYQEIYQNISVENDIIELISSFNIIVNTYEYKKTFLNEPNIPPVLQMLINKIFIDLVNISGVSIESEILIAEFLYELDDLLDIVDEDEFFNVLTMLSNDLRLSAVRGVALSILCKHQRITENYLIDCIEKSLNLGSLNNEMTYQFLYFAIVNHRSLLIENKNFISILDGYFCSLDKDEFLNILPLYRLLFGSLKRVEIKKLAEVINEINQTDENLLVKLNVSPDTIRNNSLLESNVILKLKQRGVSYE